MKHLNRNWNSLSDLKDYLQKNQLESIIYFDGLTLKTNKGNYGLAFGRLSFEKKNNA
jgi:hypothetical protein